MSDYRVKISVSNARIRKAIEAAGYTSVLQMCRVKNLSISATFNLVNMKTSPRNKNGEWRLCVLKLADALYSLPDDLFSEQQKLLVLKTSTGTRDVTESELVRISEQYIWDNRLEDMQDNEGVRQIAHEQAENLIEQAMDAALTSREKQVLNMRFGMHGSTKTFNEVGEELYLTQQRIRQIQDKALRKLRAYAKREKSKVGKILNELRDDISE